MNDTRQQGPLMIPLKEAARRSGLSYECLRRMCESGQVACFRTGVKWLINWNALERGLYGEGFK